MSARQRAITATWVATLTAATTDEQLAETMRRDPTICIELLGDDRHPVRVSVRPAEDLPQTDPLGLAPQLAARPAAPDLYHGPARDEWAAALSAVHALTPVDGEDDVPDADGSPLPDPALDHSSHSMQWVGGCPECPPALTPVSVEEQGDNR